MSRNGGGQRRNRTTIKGQACAYGCGRQATTVEHVVPLSAGIDICRRKINQIPVCSECNASKGGRWPNETEQARFFAYWNGELEGMRQIFGIARAVQKNVAGAIPETPKPKITMTGPDGKEVLGPRHRRRRRGGFSQHKAPAPLPAARVDKLRPMSSVNVPVRWTDGIGERIANPRDPMPRNKK